MYLDFCLGWERKKTLKKRFHCCLETKTYLILEFGLGSHPAVFRASWLCAQESLEVPWEPYVVLMDWTLDGSVTHLQGITLILPFWPFYVIVPYRDLGLSSKACSLHVQNPGFHPQHSKLETKFLILRSQWQTGISCFKERKIKFQITAFC